jgi:hypothetical protein
MIVVDRHVRPPTDCQSCGDFPATVEVLAGTPERVNASLLLCTYCAEDLSHQLEVTR